MLKDDADPLPRNAAGVQAVEIAVGNEDADIVAMLRMAAARKEMMRNTNFQDKSPRNRKSGHNPYIWRGSISRTFSYKKLKITIPLRALIDFSKKVTEHFCFASPP